MSERNLVLRNAVLPDFPKGFLQLVQIDDQIMIESVQFGSTSKTLKASTDGTDSQVAQCGGSVRSTSEGRVGQLLFQRALAAYPSVGLIGN